MGVRRTVPNKAERTAALRMTRNHRHTPEPRMGTTLSQRKKALKQALISAKPTAEILHAAAELQRAIQGGAVGPSSGTNPTHAIW